MKYVTPDLTVYEKDSMKRFKTSSSFEVTCTTLSTISCKSNTISCQSNSLTTQTKNSIKSEKILNKKKTYQSPNIVAKDVDTLKSKQFDNVKCESLSVIACKSNVTNQEFSEVMCTSNALNKIKGKK